MKKRLISALLAVVMLVSLVPMAALADTNGRSRQDAVDWMAQQVGKSLDYDNYNGAQCVDLIKYYYDFLGCASYAKGDAYEYKTNALPDGWTRIEGAQPHPGDILVYDKSDSSPYGHVALYEDDCVTYHQNFNGHDYVERVEYYYSFEGGSTPYWGVIRPDFKDETDVKWLFNSTDAPDYEHANISISVDFSAPMFVTKTGIEMADKNGKIVYSSEESPNKSYSRIDFDYTVPYPGAEYRSVRLYIVADGKEYETGTDFAMVHYHRDITKVVEPTCTEKGYTQHGCTCGEGAYRDNYTAALGHDFKDGVCTRCGADLASLFVDVAKGSYCYNAVQWAVTNGVTAGTDSTHFAPNAGCTRAQVVTFLWRAAGEPKSNANVSFVDVKEGSYYYEAVKWAVENKITAGTDATHFAPNATCTRGQVVSFLYRADGSPDVSTASSFVDVAPTSYCYNAVNWAVMNKVTAGTDASHFSPNATCTRGQVVTFLYRASV